MYGCSRAQVARLRRTQLLVGEWSLHRADTISKADVLELICAAVPAIADDYAADAADYAADDYAADAAGEGDVVGPVCPRRPSCAPPAGAQQRSLESPRRALGSAGA